MSIKATVTCDGCGAVAGPADLFCGPTDQPAAVKLTPPGWEHLPAAKPPYLYHACKPACRAVIELRYFMEDV